MDVRLTMGGEPTFVSIDDMDGPEWNTEAVGPAKKKISLDLMADLRKKWAPGGLLHLGQGKWYPGESLPRWAFTCIWAKNGTPLWTHDDLIADESKDYGFGPDDAKRFIKGLVQVLGITDQYVRPAYEDIFYFLYKERRLPVNVDPSDSKLKDPEERARMTAVFEKDLGQVIGYVLPIQYGSWKPAPGLLKAASCSFYRVIHPSV